MIEHGIVEASRYTPHRSLSPTLHAVGDFVEVRYNSEKDNLSSEDSQTQTATQSASAPPACSKQNGLPISTWKNVEESLVESRINAADALTFIPCESGSLTDIGEILLCDKGPMSSSDATVKYGDESPGVHSTHSKTGVALSDPASVSVASRTDNVGTSCNETLCQNTSRSEVICRIESTVSDRTDDVVKNTVDMDCQADETSTRTNVASDGKMMLYKTSVQISQNSTL